MTVYLIHTRKPDTLVHILDEDSGNAYCQLFNNKYVKKSSYYKSYENINGKLCKNCLSLTGQDDFAIGPEYADHWKSL